MAFQVLTGYECIPCHGVKNKLLLDKPSQYRDFGCSPWFCPNEGGRFRFVCGLDAPIIKPTRGQATCTVPYNHVCPSLN